MNPRPHFHLPESCELSCPAQSLPHHRLPDQTYLYLASRKVGSPADRTTSPIYQYLYQ